MNKISRQMTLKQINKAITQLTPQMNFNVLKFSFGDIELTKEQLENELNEKIVNELTEIDTYLKISNDKSYLKSKLIEGNVQGNVHTLINKIDQLTKEKQLYEKYEQLSKNTYNKIYFKNEDIKIVNDVVSSINEARKSVQSLKVKDYYMLPLSKEEIQNKMKTLKKEFVKCQDELDRLNNTIKVDVELNQETLDYLGLD